MPSTKATTTKWWMNGLKVLPSSCTLSHPLARDPKEYQHPSQESSAPDRDSGGCSLEHQLQALSSTGSLEELKEQVRRSYPEIDPVLSRSEL
eukprot:447880-Hanusia_phi.AAC.1